MNNPKYRFKIIENSYVRYTSDLGNRLKVYGFCSEKKKVNGDSEKSYLISSIPHLLLSGRPILTASILSTKQQDNYKSGEFKMTHQATANR